MSKPTLAAIGDIFTAERPHEDMWAALREAGETLAFNQDTPYQIQHTANADSLLFGYRPEWRDGWSRNRHTDQLIDVPPFGIDALRQAVDSQQLEALVRQHNASKIVLQD
jgi:hypothetical protein